MIPFKVGDKVVCVDAIHFGQQLRKGAVYTIRAIGEEEGFYRYEYIRSVAVWLVEVINNCSPKTRPDAGFCARRFRPLIERKTDISIFTAMLNKSPEVVSS